MSGQLQSLTGYLMAQTSPRLQTFFAAEQTTGTMHRKSKALGLGQQLIGVVRYKAELSWLDFPYRDFPPEVIYAHVLAWLDDSANALFEELSLPDPDIDVSLNTEQGTCDLYITLELAEEIAIAPDKDGEIALRGQRWAVILPDVWTAEEVTVHASIEEESGD